MTVSDLLERVSSRELTEWWAFEQMYGPVDPNTRVDWAAALVAERVQYMLTSPKGRRKLKDVAGYVPIWDKERSVELGDNP